MQAIINGEMYEVEPAVKAYIEQLEEKNNYLLEKIQSFYKNEKLDLIERGRFLRELNDKIDENAKCRMAVTADELLEFIEEFEPVTEGELVARFSELEEENARLEESFQRATGEIAADPLPRHGRWERRNPLQIWLECSLCSWTIDRETNYCPNCGAIMDGGAEDA
jgi:rubrerythrin